MSVHPGTRFFGGFNHKTRFEVSVPINHAIDRLSLIGGMAIAEDVIDWDAVYLHWRKLRGLRMEF